ncbi:MAG: DUF2889 domain-containing protein [Pusillimonas sp.]
MPLPPPDIAREPLHTRSIRVNSFAREDGQWDLEAELVDLKAYDFPKRVGTVHRAGDPIHHMHLRVTINDQFTITSAVADYDAAPYQENCTSIAADYHALVGMNLLRNFRQAVKDRFGRTAGCTHMTELSYVLPTVAVQTMANQRRLEQESPAHKRPFQLEGCHALRLNGPVVRTFYPTWYMAPKAGARCD